MSDVQTVKLKVDFVNPRVGDKPASIKADNKYWSVTDEDIAKIKQGETYHFAYKTKAGTGKWSGRTFLDITGIIAADSSGNGAQASTAAPATNGHAAPNPKDRRITVLAISKLVDPIAFTNRDTMANQMTEILLAAEDAFERVFNDEIPF